MPEDGGLRSIAETCGGVVVDPMIRPSPPQATAARAIGLYHLEMLWHAWIYNYRKMRQTF
jgi:hypothetical protein